MVTKQKRNKSSPLPLNENISARKHRLFADSGGQGISQIKHMHLKITS